MNGAFIEGQRPSSEWRFHLDGCLQIGKPPLLPKQEIERVRRKMAGQGYANVSTG